MTKVNMSGWSQEQMANWQDPMLAGFGGPKGRAEEQILTQYADPPSASSDWQQTSAGGLSALGTAMGVGLGGLAGNSNLSDLLNRQRDLYAGGQHPFIQRPPREYQYPRQQPQYDVAGGFEEFGETLGGYKETLGGYGEKLGGFGETLGGYGEQISGFEEQLGGFGEQFSGIQEQVGGVGEDIGEINERLGGIEEGISTLSVSKPEQKQNPYSNMFNPFSFIGNWGGSRSRMSYR